MNLRRKKFQKLIPEYIERDFAVRVRVERGDFEFPAIVIYIKQNTNTFYLHIKRKGGTYNTLYSRAIKRIYLTTGSIKETYARIKELLIEDGLLTHDEVIIQDVIK